MMKGSWMSRLIRVRREMTIIITAKVGIGTEIGITTETMIETIGAAPLVAIMKVGYREFHPATCPRPVSVGFGIQTDRQDNNRHRAIAASSGDGFHEVRGLYDKHS